MDARDTKCRLCPAPTEKRFTHCAPCMAKLLAAGTCKRCGERPRVPRRQQKPHERYAPKQPDYCRGCLDEMAAACRAGRETVPDGLLADRQAAIELRACRNRSSGGDWRWKHGRRY